MRLTNIPHNLQRKIFAIAFISLFSSLFVFAQKVDIVLASQVIQGMKDVLTEYETYRYKAQMLFKEFSSDTFEVRNFDVSYRLNPENVLYGYEWNIAEKLASGDTYTFMILPSEYYIIYDGNKVMGQHKMPDVINLGAYPEYIRNNFILDQVFAPFIDGHYEEVTVVDSNNYYYVTRQMSEFATDLLVLNKESFLPLKDISTIKGGDFDLKQIMEIVFYFDENIRNPADTVFSPEHYLSLGYNLKVFDENDVVTKNEVYVFPSGKEESLLTYNFVTEKNVTSSIQSFEGKYIVLDFWYSSCMPCLKSMPILNQISERYSDSDLQVIGINCTDKGNSTFLASKLREKNINFPLLFGSGDLLQSLGIRSFPSYLLISPDLKITYIDGDVYEVEKILESVLGK